MTLRDAWEGQAQRWVAWARAPGHDSYWALHRDWFLRLLPPPDGITVDVGCGEGRLPRDLTALGHTVIGIDASRTLLDHARTADPEGDYRLADAAKLPVGDGSAMLVTAFMSLQDVDDMPGAVREAARVLAPAGRLCLAIVHPINSAGAFASMDPDAPFTIVESYFERRIASEELERDGLGMTFVSEHRPLQAYFEAIEAAGMLVERLVEVPDPGKPAGDRWQRIPLFLQIRAVKA